MKTVSKLGYMHMLVVVTSGHLSTAITVADALHRCFECWFVIFDEDVLCAGSNKRKE